MPGKKEQPDMFDTQAMDYAVTAFESVLESATELTKAWLQHGSGNKTPEAVVDAYKRFVSAVLETSSEVMQQEAE